MTVDEARRAHMQAGVWEQIAAHKHWQAEAEATRLRALLVDGAEDGAWEAYYAAWTAYKAAKKAHADATAAVDEAFRAIERAVANSLGVAHAYSTSGYSDPPRDPRDWHDYYNGSGGS